MEVKPAVCVAIDADGEVLQALGIDFLDRVLNDGLRVLELERRKATPPVTAPVTSV